MTNREKLQKFYDILDRLGTFERTIGKMNFDMQVCAPKEGMDQAAEDIAELGKYVYRLTHSEEYENLLTELHENPSELNTLEKRAIDCRYDIFQKEKAISPELDFEMDTAIGKAYGSWLEAKEKADFSLFRDSLAEVIRLRRKCVECRPLTSPTCYDSLLDDFEKGGSIAKMDEFFAKLKARIVPLIRRIKAEGKPIRDDFLTRSCPIPEQEAFSKYLLRLEGLREDALVLMTTEHPFTDNYGPHDVRVTTHYFEDNFISNIFSTLHEGGHALFMQNEPDAFHKAHTDNFMSNAMHECISRFYENDIGKSRAFIHFIYPELCRFSPSVMEDVSEQELYEAVNIASPGLIRMDADELTYSMHILIRYELEKAFMNGEITVDEIPMLWNQKYHDILGLEVPNDALGCLQDVHWTSDFGYFPSYALGSAYGAQIMHRMKQDFDVDAAVASGDLSLVLEWLKAHVFNCASLLDPDDWIRAVTGESLNVDYFLDYIEDKFTRLYALK